MHKLILAIIPILIVLQACTAPARKSAATIHHVEPDASAPKRISIKTSVAGRSASGFLSAIRGGTNWDFFGSLEEGDVYKPVDSALVVEDTKTIEAYLVVHQKKWVGVYLPATSEFSTIRQAMPLELE